MSEFLGLPFVERMLPSPEDTVPFGNRFADRWYPLRAGVNERHLAGLPKRFERKIVERAGDLAAGLGYPPPARR